MQQAFCAAQTDYTPPIGRISFRELNVDELVVAETEVVNNENARFRSLATAIGVLFSEPALFRQIYADSVVLSVRHKLGKLLEHLDRGTRARPPAPREVSRTHWGPATSTLRMGPHSRASK